MISRGVGGPCREGIRGSGMVIEGGIGGGCIELCLAGKLWEGAGVAPMPGMAIPPNGGFVSGAGEGGTSFMLSWLRDSFIPFVVVGLPTPFDIGGAIEEGSS